MSNILQFKITLNDSSPQIWRRFEVEDNATFYDLHLIIQTVMGWSNTHLYQFIYEGNNYIGNPELLERDDIADAKDTAISVAFDKPTIEMKYEYDFGDGWQHELVLEKILAKDPGHDYPTCLEGEMKCPPEDCGGIPFFYEQMKAYKNKRHPEHKHIKELLGPDFDPKHFDLEAVNENLKNYRDLDFGFN